MASLIDPSKPEDGLVASKAALRSNLQLAKDEIEALQAGKTDLGHSHMIEDIANAGALASKDTVTGADIAPNAVGGEQLQDGIPISMQDAVLSGAELRDFSETSPTLSVSDGALSLDLETGNVFEAVLTEDLATLSFVNPPAAGRAGTATLILKQDGTGGRTVTWPGTVKWSNSSAPALTTTADAIDVLTFVTRDGGSTWFGFLGGKDFG
ncbi:MAG: hypothetical protein ACFB6S_19720 [Geminicoccaceae bacterium]